MPVARLNTFALDTALGTRRFNLYRGDVTEAAAELLALSTHANPNLEITGEVLGCLRRRFRSEVTEVKPHLLIRDVAGTYLATCEPKPPFEAVLVVRLPGVNAVQSEGGEPIEVYNDILWSLFGSIAALELRGRGFR